MGAHTARGGILTSKHFEKQLCSVGADLLGRPEDCELRPYHRAAVLTWTMMQNSVLDTQRSRARSPGPHVSMTQSSSPSGIEKL